MTIFERFILRHQAAVKWSSATGKRGVPAGFGWVEPLQATSFPPVLHVWIDDSREGAAARLGWEEKTLGSYMSSFRCKQRACRQQRKGKEESTPRHVHNKEREIRAREWTDENPLRGLTENRQSRCFFANKRERWGQPHVGRKLVAGGGSDLRRRAGRPGRNSGPGGV